MNSNATVKAEGSDKAVGSGVSSGAGRSNRNAIVREGDAEARAVFTASEQVREGAQLVLLRLLSTLTLQILAM
ncbi:MAG: hypothetical protein ACKPKO_14810, partial [Candidatus Fonsibacter sp.]